MIYSVAVDGPSASGKSTVCSLLAKKLNINHLSSGALYRAVALYIFENNLDYKNQLENILKSINIEVKFDNFFQIIILNGKNVTNKLQTNEISLLSSIIAQNEKVREYIKEIQVNLTKKESIIIDGRDITNVVLPNADFKFFVTASVESRSYRRYLQYEKKVPLEKIKKDIILRDERDSTRELSPLKIVEDAIIVDSSNLTIDETVDFMYNKIVEKLKYRS